MGAHLYAVPDEPEDQQRNLMAAVPSLYLPRPAHHGGPGEYPLAPPAPAAPAAAPADDEAAQEHPLDGGQDEEQLLADEPGEQHLDEHQEDEDQWEPGRRAVTFPDLRPYADVPEAARLLVSGTLAVGRLTVEHAPAGGRLLWRAATAAGRLLRTATAHVAAVLGPGAKAAFGWCHGGEGAAGPFKRAAIVAASLFAAGHAAGIPGPWRLAAPAVWFCGFLLGGRRPDQAPAEDGAKAPKGKAKGKVKEPAPVSKESGPPPAAPAVLRADDPAEAVEESPGDVAETPQETPAETPAEPPVQAPAAPPPPPSREALTEALHHLYSGGAGVLHTALREHLHLTDTRAVKAALTVAGIRYREGVRTPAGSGPGTHLNDFPPLPLSQGDPQGPAVGAGQSANNNNANSGEGSGEGFRVERTDSGFTVFDPNDSHRLTSTD